MHDEKLLKTEQLLREAAEWEPGGAPPPALGAAALSAALEQERRTPPGPPRTAMFLALMLGGGMAATSVAAALWAVALPQAQLPARPQPLQKGELATIRKDPPAAWSRRVPEPEAPPAPAPQVQLAAEVPPEPVRRAPRSSSRRRWRSRQRPAEPLLPRAVWDTQEVEKRQAGLMGPAVLIQPGPSSDTVYVQPGVVSIPLDNPQTACAPVEPPAPEPESPKPALPENPDGDKKGTP